MDMSLKANVKIKKLVTKGTYTIFMSCENMTNDSFISKKINKT